jgi:hypothetical protein
MTDHDNVCTDAEWKEYCHQADIRRIERQAAEIHGKWIFALTLIGLTIYSFAMLGRFGWLPGLPPA